MRKVCFDMPKVKVTKEGKMSISSISSILMNRFQNNFTHMFSLKRNSVIQKVCFNMPNVKITVEGQMFKLTLSGA